jgi:hypothetical protein
VGQSFRLIVLQSKGDDGKAILNKDEKGKVFSREKARQILDSI